MNRWILYQCMDCGCKLIGNTNKAGLNCLQCGGHTISLRKATKDEIKIITAKLKRK